MTSNQGSPSPTDQVVQAVAHAEDVQPTELTPFGEVIDPDALNTLLSPPSNKIKKLHFQYEGYTVVIDEDKTISLK